MNQISETLPVGHWRWSSDSECSAPDPSEETAGGIGPGAGALGVTAADTGAESGQEA